jgi:hypothetical protein
MNDYFKVFDGKNKFFDVSSERDISSLKDWISENEPQTWIENKARSVYKNKPVSFVVVDVDDRGEPYLVNITSDRLVDAEVIDEKGNLGYIVFIHSILKDENDPSHKITLYSVYDQMTYWVFSKSSKSDQYNLISQNPHNLGFCPAKAFVESQSNSKNQFKRHIAFSTSLSKLEDWTIFDVYRNYLDHYAPFPVMETPIKQCANTGCFDGKVQDEQVIDGQLVTRYADCPVCEGGQKGLFVGPGTIMAKQTSSGEQMTEDVGFKMHFPDTDKMKYVPEKLDDLELEVRYKTVGVNNTLTKEAVNELQVKGSFASMESVLMRNKNDFEALYTWIVQTVGKLFYGDIQLDVVSNLGTEFYLVTEEDLQNRFEKAKLIGLPKAEQSLIYDQIIDTKYKSNPSQIERQKMLSILDPLPLYSEMEAIEIFEKGVIDESTLNLKINFQRYIARFELENGSIDKFGGVLELRKRIEIISQTLKQYNNEELQSKQLSTSQEGARGVQP